MIKRTAKISKGTATNKNKINSTFSYIYRELKYMT